MGLCRDNWTPYPCVDLGNDPTNCGAPGQVCPSGQTCANGECSGDISPCSSGRIGLYCSLDGGGSEVCCQGAGCTDFQTDPNNCGSCGASCSLGLACLGGQCVATTCASQPQGQLCSLTGGATGLCCGGACANPSNDSQNCGGCSTVCAGSQTCNSGNCGFDSCSTPLQGDRCHLDAGGGISGGSCCGLACVDTATDPQNCGGCNLACGAGAGCVASNCM